MENNLTVNNLLPYAAVLLIKVKIWPDNAGAKRNPTGDVDILLAVIDCCGCYTAPPVFTMDGVPTITVPSSGTSG